MFQIVFCIPEFIVCHGVHNIKQFFSKSFEGKCSVLMFCGASIFYTAFLHFKLSCAILIKRKTT